MKARPQFSDAGLSAEAAAAPASIITFGGVFPMEFLTKETPMNGASDESAPTGIGHNSGAVPPEGYPPASPEKLALLAEQIAMAIGAQRAAGVQPSALGQLKGAHRIKTLRNSYLLNAARFCRRNPQADTRLAVLAYITFLADNKDGACRLSVRKMSRLFKRSDRAIVDCITSLEADGLIGVVRKSGSASIYWPIISREMVAANLNAAWIAPAMTDSSWPKKGNQSEEQTTEADFSGATAEGEFSGDKSAEADFSGCGNEEAQPLKAGAGTAEGGHRLYLSKELAQKDSPADAGGARATEDLLSGVDPSQGADLTGVVGSAVKAGRAKGGSAAKGGKSTEEQWLRFWAAYPIRDGKAAAQRNFTKLTHAEAELAVYGAGQYAAKVAGEREKLARRGEEPKVKWAQGWLSERRFEDYEDAYGSASTNDVEAALRRHAASADGQRVLARYGQEEGLRRLREIITDSTKGAS